MNELAKLPSSIKGPVTVYLPVLTYAALPMWSRAVGVGSWADDSTAVAPFASCAFGGGSGFGPTVSYGTTVNTVEDKQKYLFWDVLANSVSQLNRHGIHATTTWSIGMPGEAASGDVSSVVWGTLLMAAIDYHTSLAPERADIIDVIENSLVGRNTENPISPSNLLRACAVGASIGQALPDSPHIYAAPGGRIILDYALSEGRFSAVVTDEYVHLLGTLHGTFRDRTITKEAYDLVELQNWVRAN